MKKKEIDQIIEALFFANPSPINQAQLNQVFNSPAPSLKESVKRLNDFYLKYEKPYSIKKQHKYKNNIHNCHICNKNLSNQTIYRCNDLSFCSIKHRDSQNELKI